MAVHILCMKLQLISYVIVNFIVYLVGKSYCTIFAVL